MSKEERRNELNDPIGSISDWSTSDIVLHPIFQEGYMWADEDTEMKRHEIKRTQPETVKTPYESGSIEAQLFERGARASIN